MTHPDQTVSEPFMPTVDLPSNMLVKVASGETITWAEACKRLAAAPSPEAEDETKAEAALWKAHDERLASLQRPQTTAPDSAWLALKEAAEDFVAKVERGEARSKRSYEAFVCALGDIAAAQARKGAA